MVPEGNSGIYLFGRAAVVKCSDVPALTPDNNSIERKVSLNILLPLGRQHFWAAESMNIYEIIQALQWKDVVKKSSIYLKPWKNSLSAARSYWVTLQGLPATCIPGASVAPMALRGQQKAAVGAPCYGPSPSLVSIDS